MTPEIAHLVHEFFQPFPTKEYGKGEIIVRPTQDMPGILYLEEGRISQYDIANDGRKVVVNIFQPPSFFPMAWAINKTKNIYFFEASTAVRVHCAPPGKVVDFVLQHPEILLNLLGRVYRGTEGTQRRLAHSLGGKASSLVVFEVITACQRLKLENTKSYELNLTHQELSERTGLSRETVNRQLQELKGQGLIELGYGFIVIPNLGKLEELLGSRL